MKCDDVQKVLEERISKADRSVLVALKNYLLAHHLDNAGKAADL
jgi:hypothetical protein